MNLPAGKTRLHSVIIEEAKAWEECQRCANIYGWYDSSCPDCNGRGGQWHEAVHITNEYHPIVLSPSVTKDTILIREWGVCSVCKGSKVCPAKVAPCASNCPDCAFLCREDYGSYGYICLIDGECPHCRNEETLVNTGAEPDSAGEWRVKE